ncbi:PLD-like domain-containing protein [Variovorax sp. YR216]|nr:phospholipase D family protein [Variovorax sp. YR216]SEB26312.1 PLD-like domain-containing protein [Variovorax sp. YR216]
MTPSIKLSAAIARLLAPALLIALASAAHARGPAPSVPDLPATHESVEVAFSPDGGAEGLVIQVIGSANSSIRLAAYSFTSPSVVRALLDAKRRGVDVAVVVDHKNNLTESRTHASREALNLLINAGIPTRTVSVYAIHHDKYIVVDGRHVETGSFNFTAAAAKRNSENVLVVRNDPALAAQYIAHWQSRWAQGQPYRSTY